MTGYDREVHVAAVGTALPGPPVDNAALARVIGSESVFEQWIDTFIGIRTRHLSVDLETGEIHYSLADLGETAGRRAMSAAGVTPDDIDVVVMGTATPDALMPATVNLIADRLGVNEVPTYQLQSGCTGAVQAIDVAARMLRGGPYRTALVLGGDVCAKHVDLSVDFSRLAPSELVNMILFGDGSGAVVLSVDPPPAPVALREVLVRFVGRGRPPGQVVEWFGMGDRADGRVALREDFKAIEEQVPGLARATLEELLRAQGWIGADLDYLLPPQLSVRMTDEIVKHLGVHRATPVNCVADIGNAANALPFFQLEQLLPMMRPGDRAVAIAIESSKWIKAGLVLERV
ncbi:3-oxoacyl-ACP synthase III family protein [Micromonospora rifamycinica]|uniref:3-oxoacyl-ACP synthase III family protein n=1 Tax=Micromonospora rifamycinica TaxID=291594 RepID=UPI003431A0C0